MESTRRPSFSDHLRHGRHAQTLIHPEFDGDDVWKMQLIVLKGFDKQKH